MTKIAASLRQFVTENFLFGQECSFSDGDSFLDLEIIDSTGVLELVAFLEREYQIRIADQELIPENLDSIERLVRFVQAKLAPPASEGAAAAAGLPADLAASATITPATTPSS